MSGFIAQSGLALFAPTAYAQIVAPVASGQSHFTILGILALVLGDIGEAQETSEPFDTSPTTIVASGHFTINGKPVATLGVATAPPLGLCTVAGTNGFFSA